MTQIIPTDVYDKDGNLLRVEYHNLEGEFEIQAEWDERDEQNSENRERFRKWATTMVKRLGFEVKT
jgi:hypothetical protein